MIHEIIPIRVPGADGAAELTVYAPDNFPETGAGRLRTALIICPGGGYHRLSDREGAPGWGTPPSCCATMWLLRRGGPFPRGSCWPRWPTSGTTGRDITPIPTPSS